MLPSDEFWEENKFKIVAALLVLLVAAFGFIGWTAWQQSSIKAAGAAFSQAATPEEWREVLTKFAGTPVAENSGLLLAAALREQGNIEASDAAYEAVLAERKDFGLQSAAALGIAQNAILLAGGKPEPAAVSALQAVWTRFPDSYAAPFALYLEGEMLIREGREAEAVQIFRNLLADHPNAVSGQIASMQMQRLAPAITASEEAASATTPVIEGEPTELAPPAIEADPAETTAPDAP